MRVVCSEATVWIVDTWAATIRLNITTRCVAIAFSAFATLPLAEEFILVRTRLGSECDIVTVQKRVKRGIAERDRGDLKVSGRSDQQKGKGGGAPYI